LKGDWGGKKRHLNGEKIVECSNRPAYTTENKHREWRIYTGKKIRVMYKVRDLLGEGESVGPTM